MRPEISERSKGAKAEVVAGRNFRAEKTVPDYPAARDGPDDSNGTTRVLRRLSTCEEVNDQKHHREH